MTVLETKISPGTIINNRYEIHKVLGQGGFGRTYLASDNERFEELCVLKEFLPENRGEGMNTKSRELFEREAKVLYQINHPQIPKFLAWFIQMGRLFIVQEFIDGETYANLLHRRLQQGQAFSEAEIVQWLQDLLPVLTYLHDRKIVHRDISPDNIMLQNFQSLPVLIDFGLVKQAVTQVWAVNSGIANRPHESLVGKTGYSPTEQIRMGQSFPASDLYSLAVTALVLLTGKEPTLLMDMRTLEWHWRSYIQVSDRLGSVLNKMLRERVQDRYQSAAAVIAELQSLDRPVSVVVPQQEFRIEIDQARKERQIAEIEEMDFFQQLQQQAEELRNSSETQSVGDRVIETPAMEPPATPPAKPAAINSQNPTAAASPLDPAFIERCRQKLAVYIGPMASFAIEEALEDNPNLSAPQLIELLVAEIPDSKAALEFRLHMLL